MTRGSERGRSPCGRPPSAEPSRRRCRDGWGIWNLTTDQRGVIALEFALVLPVLILLCFGTVEVGRFVLLQMKLDQLAAAVADLGTRERTLSTATIDDIFAAGAHIVQPFDLAADGRVTLSGVGRAAGDEPRVLWQRRSGGTLDVPSETGTVGGLATLPDEIVLAVGQTVVVAEVSFSYRGMFGLLPERITTKRAYFRPRLGSLQQLSEACSPGLPLVAWG